MKKASFYKLNSTKGLVRVALSRPVLAGDRICLVNTQTNSRSINSTRYNRYYLEYVRCLSIPTRIPYGIAGFVRESMEYYYKKLIVNPLLYSHYLRNSKMELIASCALNSTTIATSNSYITTNRKKDIFLEVLSGEEHFLFVDLRSSVSTSTYLLILHK